MITEKRLDLQLINFFSGSVGHRIHQAVFHQSCLKSIAAQS